MDNDKRHLPPERIRQILSLHMQHCGKKNIAARTGISINSVRQIIAKFESLYANLSAGAGQTGLPDDSPAGDHQSPEKFADSLMKLPNELLDARFYAESHLMAVRADTVSDGKYYPDFAAIAALAVVEKRRPISQVYRDYQEECRRQNASELSQAHFYKRISQEIEKINAENQDYYFIQDFNYGDYVEIDFTGDRYRLETNNGTVDCWVMVFAFPASYYAYATFVSAQSTIESCRAIRDMVTYLDHRMPAILKCDNYKGAITSHKGTSIFYNVNFQNFMRQLGMIIDPAPVRKPQRKSCVEHTVGLLESRIGGDGGFRSELRKTKTFSEHCDFLQQLVEKLINKAPFRKSADKTREFLFNTYERPRLKRADVIPSYEEVLEHIQVPPSYHINVGNHLYSVPHTCIRSCVEVHLTNDHVIVYRGGIEIARHLRKDGKPGEKGRTTDPRHCPPAHQEIMRNNERFSTPEAVLKIAGELDSAAGGLVRFCRKKIEQQLGDPTLAIHNTLASCAAVIRLYESSPYPDLVSRACDEVLSRQPARMWNKAAVEQQYRKISDDELARRRSPGKPMINHLSADEAYY